MAKDDSGIQNRLSQQAALILNCDQIIEKYNIANQVGSKITRETIKYRNFSTIRESSNGSKSTEFHEITSLITKNKDYRDLFYKLPPQLLSILQPSIKLYKIFYPSSQIKDVSKTLSNGYDWRIPFDDVAIGVKDSTYSSEFVNNTLTEIISGAGRLNGVGIKSFNYSYVGINPAEINTNIVANLELFVATPDDLINSINVTKDDPRFINKNVDKLPDGLTFSYADLINQSSRFMTNALSEEKDINLLPNEAYYRIKAVVGYAMPPENYFNQLNLTTEEITKIKSIINTSKIILLLTPYKHNLDFNENGNIVLKIEYHAMIDKMLASQEADVLRSSSLSGVDYYQKYLDAKKAYDISQSKKTKEIDKIKCKYKNNATEKYQEELKKIDESNKNTIEEALKNLKIANLDLYSSLTKNILNLTYDVRKYSGVFVAELSPVALGVTGLEDSRLAKVVSSNIKNSAGVFGAASVVSDVLQTATNFVLSAANSGGERVEDADKQRIKNITNARMVNSVAPLDNSDKEKLRKERIDEPSEEIKKDIEKLKVSEELQKKSESENEELNPSYNNFIKVKFIFLGDVLDAALECLKRVKPSATIPRIILGNIRIDIPVNSTIGEDENLSVDTMPVDINLADIPISFELLNSFLIDKLIKQGKTSYPVLNFIRDVITELVMNCISPKYFGSAGRINTKQRITNTIISVPYNKNNDILLNLNKEYFSSNRSIYDGMPYLSLSNIADRKKEIKNFASSDIESLLSNDVSNYCFIYCSTKFNEQGNIGDEEKDVENGIYHFRMGVDNGIIKKISFSQTDSQFYREAVAAQEGKGNVSVIKQVYDASIEMFGNNIYRPGDIIYVEPYVSFRKPFREMANPKKNQQNPEKIIIDLQDKVGLGGYYMVTEINTAINENVFNTSLKAVFKAHKYAPSNNNSKDC